MYSSRVHTRVIRLTLLLSVLGCATAEKPTRQSGPVVMDPAAAVAEIKKRAVEAMAATAISDKDESQFTTEYKAAVATARTAADASPVDAAAKKTADEAVEAAATAVNTKVEEAVTAQEKLRTDASAESDDKFELLKEGDAGEGSKCVRFLPDSSLVQLEAPVADTESAADVAAAAAAKDCDEFLESTDKNIKKFCGSSSSLLQLEQRAPAAGAPAAAEDPPPDAAAVAMMLAMHHMNQPDCKKWFHMKMVVQKGRTGEIDKQIANLHLLKTSEGGGESDAKVYVTDRMERMKTAEAERVKMKVTQVGVEENLKKLEADARAKENEEAKALNEKHGKVVAKMAEALKNDWSEKEAAEGAYLTKTTEFRKEMTDNIGKLTTEVAKGDKDQLLTAEKAVASDAIDAHQLKAEGDDVTRCDALRQQVEKPLTTASEVLASLKPCVKSVLDQAEILQYANINSTHANIQYKDAFGKVFHALRELRESDLEVVFTKSHQEAWKNLVDTSQTIQDTLSDMFDPTADSRFDPTSADLYRNYDEAYVACQKATANDQAELTTIKFADVCDKLKKECTDVAGAMQDSCKQISAMMMNLQGHDDKKTELIENLCKSWNLIETSEPICIEKLPLKFTECKNMSDAKGKHLAKEWFAVKYPRGTDGQQVPETDVMKAEREKNEKEEIEKEMATCEGNLLTSALSEDWFVTQSTREQSECTAGYDPADPTKYIDEHDKTESSYTQHRNSDQALCEKLMDRCFRKDQRENGEPDAAGPFFGCRSMSEWVSNISFTTTDDLIARGKLWCDNIGLADPQKATCKTDINSAFCVYPSSGDKCKEEITDPIKAEQDKRIAKMLGEGDKDKDHHCRVHDYSDYLKGRWQEEKAEKAAEGGEFEAIDGNKADDVRDCFTAAFQFLRKQDWFKSVKIEFAEKQLQSEIECRRAAQKEPYTEPADGCVDKAVQPAVPT